MLTPFVRGMTRELMEKMAEEQQYMRALNKRCQDAIASILKEEGFIARIVYYPIDGVKGRKGVKVPPDPLADK